jgi:hypothetical protein
MKIDLNWIVLVILLGLLLILYHLYIKKWDDDDSVTFTFDEIKRFLKKGRRRHRKPLLWIHVPYEYNSRRWENFYSRKTKALNQGYLYLTLKTIIDRCKKSFHICLIDDNTLDHLNDDVILPKHKHLTDPLKTYFRFLSKCKLLHEYGGLFVPLSFLCFKDVYPMYPTDSESIIMNFDQNILKDDLFIGCQQYCTKMDEIIHHIRKVILKEGFNEQCIFFDSKLERFLLRKINGGIDSRVIGLRDKHNKRIKIEDLMSSEYLKIEKDIYGILIPQKEILKRTKYQWFARLSPEQVVDADMILSKYILLALAATNDSPFENFFEIR